MSESVLITLITALATVIVGVVSALAKQQAAEAQRRIDEAESRAEDHEERLNRLEPAFGDAVVHIRDLRGHINRGEPPPPPQLPGSLIRYYFE